MPKIQVPKSEGPQVRQGPVNAARPSADAPIEAFGGGPGLDRQTTAQREILQNVQKIAVEEKAKADQLAFQDADVELAKLSSRLEIEAAKKQGKDAAEAPDFVSAEWDKGVEEIRKGLKNDNQRAKFEKARALRQVSLNSSVQRHTFNELDKYDTESSNSAIENYRNDAVLHYNDTRVIENSIIMQEETYLGWAKRKGLGKEQITEGLRDIHTKTHTAVVTQMLSDGDSSGAVEYYEDNKDFLPPQQRLEIKKMIDEEKVENDAEAVAAGIMAKAGPEIRETENLLNDIKDENTREKVKEKLEPLIRQAVEVQNTRQAEIGSRIADEAYSLADLKKDEAILPKDFVNAVQVSRKNKTQNSAFKSSWDGTYLSLMESYMKISGMDPENQSGAYATLRKEILVNKPKLRDGHYRELLKMTDPKYVQQNKEKSGPLSGVVKWFQETFAGNPGKGARATEELMQKAKTTSPEKLPETAKAIVDKENARDNALAVRYKEAKTITTPRGTTLKVIGEAADGTPIIEVPE